LRYADQLLNRGYFLLGRSGERRRHAAFFIQLEENEQA
jgi:hypothetical protein